MMKKNTVCSGLFLISSLLTTVFVPTQVNAHAVHSAKLKTNQVIELSLEQRQQILNSLLKEQWEYKLRTNPELASMLGDKRYNDQWHDFSQAAIDKDHEANKQFLKRFKEIDTQGFSVQEKLNKTLMVNQLQDEVDAIAFKNWQMPVLHNSGLHLDTPELVNMLSFSTVTGL